MSGFTNIFSKSIPIRKLLADFVSWQNDFEYGQLGYYELNEHYPI